MASLATVYSRVTGSAARSEGFARITSPKIKCAPVRAFPNEDIYFFVKRIDNSRVVRQADPQAGGVCWKMIGSVGAAALLLIAVLLPSAYGLLAGYQIQSLREESKRLASEQASLELQEAKLVSPERMEQLARMQQFIDPEPQKVVYLDSKDGSSYALNQALNKKQ
jgi:hypothetical protein